MVCDEDEAGRPRFHFRFVDQLFGFADQRFDFLLFRGLKPFVELVFMPSLLAGRSGQAGVLPGKLRQSAAIDRPLVPSRGTGSGIPPRIECKCPRTARKPISYARCSGS